MFRRALACRAISAGDVSMSRLSCVVMNPSRCPEAVLSLYAAWSQQRGHEFPKYAPYSRSHAQPVAPRRHTCSCRDRNNVVGVRPAIAPAPSPPPPPKSLLALPENVRIRTASKSVSRSHCRGVDVGFLSRTSSFARREVELGARLAAFG